MSPLYETNTSIQNENGDTRALYMKYDSEGN
jgi:hypothetical protein